MYIIKIMYVESHLHSNSCGNSQCFQASREVVHVLMHTHCVLSFQLLEKKKGQSIDDLCQNLECLCHCMTTVGQKLDTEKAKVCPIYMCVCTCSSSMYFTCICM